MSIKDELILDFFTYTTNYTIEEVQNIKSRLQTDNPRDIKLLLAKEIIKIYHNEAEAIKCEKEFINIFSKKGIPENIPSISLEPGAYNICRVLKDNKVAASISETKRLIKQGGLRIDGKTILDEDYCLHVKNGHKNLIKAGKRRFLEIHCNIE